MAGSKLGRKLGMGKIGSKSMGTKPLIKPCPLMAMPKMKATASRVKFKNAGKRKA